MKTNFINDKVNDFFYSIIKQKMEKKLSFLGRVTMKGKIWYLHSNQTFLLFFPTDFNKTLPKIDNWQRDENCRKRLHEFIHVHCRHTLHVITSSLLCQIT